MPRLLNYVVAQRKPNPWHKLGFFFVDQLAKPHYTRPHAHRWSFLPGWTLPQGLVMEHIPRYYKTLQGVFRGMAGTLIGHVVRETVQRDVSILPLEVICFCDKTVKLIVSLGYREDAPKPLLVRAWDWIDPRPGGRPGKVRGTLHILAIDAGGQVVYRSVYPPAGRPEV
jgi:hypothetical protein